MAHRSVTLGLFAAFVAVPILEIALFIQIGGWIGLWPTLGIVVATAVVGTALMRAQGLATLQSLQSQLEHAENPVGTIAHGALILFAGALLLTPGFFTDAVGFALLVPPVRAALIKQFAHRLRGSVKFHTSAEGTATYTHGEVIEGEYQPVSPDPSPERPKRPSGWTERE